MSEIEETEEMMDDCIIDNCIVIDDKYIEINNTVDLLEFTNAKEFEYLTYKIFKFLSKKRKLEKMEVSKIFKGIGHDEINHLRLDDTFVPVNRLLLDSAFSVLEKKVGQKLMGGFLKYNDILSFQLCIKYARDYFSDKGLLNFTGAQENCSNIKYDNFMKAQNNLKEYIKIFL